MNRFHGLFRGLKHDLAVPTYQKYVSMLSHDSGDVKNIENELITTKIYTFETRRTIYIFDSFYTINTLSVEKPYFSSSDIENYIS